MPKYCKEETRFHSWKITKPTVMVLKVSRLSTTPELIATPILDVTKPKEINTKGEINNSARSQIENLSSPLAQIALMEFAETAINTAPKT